MYKYKSIIGEIIAKDEKTVQIRTASGEVLTFLAEDFNRFFTQAESGKKEEIKKKTKEKKEEKKEFVFTPKVIKIKEKGREIELLTLF